MKWMMGAAALLVSSHAVHAFEPPPPAYQLAAMAADVPSVVLFSVALQESGMRFKNRFIPWPWSLNVAGETLRFATRAEACTALLVSIQDVGPKRVDAGLGQINIGWNGHHFRSPCEALDPHKNLAVTARILKEQYDQVGDWTLAAGRYHRPAGGEPAEKYRASFSRHLARVVGDAPSPLVAKNP